MSVFKPKLIIIAGPNGSGKTTVTEQLLSHEWGDDCVYINPDNIARDLFGDWNSASSVLKAAEYSTAQRYELMEQRRNIVFETVLSSDEKIVYIKKAKECGYFVRIFFVCTESPSINAARIADRYIAGGHTVPIEKIVSRYGKSIANCAKVMKLVDRMYIFDNSVNHQPARLLFRTSSGTLTKRYVRKLPQWAEILLKKLDR
ncbi:MAG: zeta toxin family protein [Bacteroidales bacterium]|nr:zeta toxin family protein [Bacteroidales bacterium]